MVQREVARRICARENTAEYGAFTLLTQYHTAPERLFTVDPACFVPRPKVTSAVVRMRMRALPPVEADERALFRIIRAAFNQRRKTLANALEGVCGRDRAREAIKACGFPETVRGEALSLADFASLHNEIAQL